MAGHLRRGPDNRLEHICVVVGMHTLGDSHNPLQPGPHAFLARNPEFLERLRREAQIAASVYSPRVVRVIDLDTHDGLPYLLL